MKSLVIRLCPIEYQKYKPPALGERLSTVYDMWLKSMTHAFCRVNTIL